LLIAEFGDQKCELLFQGLGRFFSLRNNALGTLVLIMEKSVLTKKPISVDKRDRKKRERNERGMYKNTKKEEMKA
jgi:hypothetical protein